MPPPPILSGRQIRPRRNFQDYVTKNQISSSDTEALNAWGSDNPLIYYVILKGGKVIYPSEYKEDEMMIPDDAAEDSSPPAAEEESYYESDSQLYDIQFADGAGRLICGLWRFSVDYRRPTII